MERTIQQMLASLAQADRVEIVTSPTRLDAATRVTLRESSRIHSLLALLEPSEEWPSGSYRAGTLSFYRGDALLAEVWICANGDWGFIGGDGTVGKSKPLVDVIRELVARGSDTIETG